MRLLESLDELLRNIIVKVSFLLLLPTLAFILYYVFIDFNFYKAVVGNITLGILIYTNKSSTY